MELAVDEVRSFRCTVGSGQDGWRVGTTGRCHVFDRILEGHNHDLIALKVKTDLSRTELHHSVNWR